MFVSELFKNNFTIGNSEDFIEFIKEKHDKK